MHKRPPPPALPLPGEATGWLAALGMTIDVN